MLGKFNVTKKSKIKIPKYIYYILYIKIGDFLTNN